jgi:hypothetical protein
MTLYRMGAIRVGQPWIARAARRVGILASTSGRCSSHDGVS